MDVNGGVTTTFMTYEETAPVPQETWDQLAGMMDDLTEHQYIRKHILESAGISDIKPLDYEYEKALIEKQTSEVFSLCVNRLLMGRFRYGPNVGQSHFNCIPTIEKKIKRYKETGNMECLLDAINYLYLEFRFGTNPKKHFSATDDEDHASGEHKW